jgi:cell division protein FtsA
MLPAGAVLCGGSVKIPGMVDLARECLQLPVQIVSPRGIEGIVDRIDDPSFVSAVGLLHFANKYGTESTFFDFNFKRMFSGFGNFFKKLIP